MLAANEVEAGGAARTPHLRANESSIFKWADRSVMQLN